MPPNNTRHGQCVIRICITYMGSTSAHQRTHSRRDMRRCGMPTLDLVQSHLMRRLRTIPHHCLRNLRTSCHRQTTSSAFSSKITRQKSALTILAPIIRSDPCQATASIRLCSCHASWSHNRQLMSPSRMALSRRVGPALTAKKPVRSLSPKQPSASLHKKPSN